jgi:hypothetical protein
MLRALPADQFLSVERIRREMSARLLQRVWRKKKRYTRHIPTTQLPVSTEDPLQRDQDSLYQYMLKRLPEPIKHDSHLHGGHHGMHFDTHDCEYM